MAVADLSEEEVATFDSKLKAEPGTGVTNDEHKGRLMAYLITNPAKARSLMQLSDALLVSTLNALVPSQGAGSGGGPVPARDVLHRSYASPRVVYKSKSTRKRPYAAGRCTLVPWPMDTSKQLIQNELEAALSGVVLTAEEARVLRQAAEVFESLPVGTDRKIHEEHTLNAWFGNMFGLPAAAALNAAIVQKRLSFGRFDFFVNPLTQDPSSKPDFAFQQAQGDQLACGGEGKMPGVLGSDPKADQPTGALRDAVLQTCSYCLDQGWRFAFLTDCQRTFFLWRLDENVYAITEEFMAATPLYGLFTCELLFYIAWMSLKWPWGRPLPAELEAHATVLKRQPGQILGDENPGRAGSATAGRTGGGGQGGRPHHRRRRGGSGKHKRHLEAGTHEDAVQQQDQTLTATAAQDAPLYPLEVLELSDTCLGVGECGRVLQGRLEGQPVAVKATDVSKSPHLMERLWHEWHMYVALKHLWGVCLPHVRGCGFWRGGGSFFLATTVVPGVPLSECEDPEAAQPAAEQALHTIHQHGVAHGDIRADNLLVDCSGKEPKVYIIDLGHAYKDPTPEECDQEVQELAQVFQELSRQ